MRVSDIFPSIFPTARPPARHPVLLRETDVFQSRRARCLPPAAHPAARDAESRRAPSGGAATQTEEQHAHRTQLRGRKQHAQRRHAKERHAVRVSWGNTL